MNLKKYIQLVALLALPLSILIVGGLEAQYRGSGRPLSRQETLDSLAKKADTTATNQLQAEVDSTQDSLDTKMPRSGFLKEGANVTISEHGSPPDSITIASSGGGGNWNPADSTISFDLGYYKARNVIQIMTSDAYSGWVNYGTGTHADNATNYLTDAQSIKITANAQYDGAYLDIFKSNADSLDLTHYADGDTCVMADYFLISFFFGEGELDSLGTNGIRVNIDHNGAGGTGERASTDIAKASFSAGWNHIKIAKSAFNLNGLDWGNVDVIMLYVLDAPSTRVIFSVEYMAVVRDDPDAAEPNSFQSEGPNETWKAEWTEEGNGNIWIVEESGVVSLMSGDTYTSNITSVASWGDYTVSGKTKLTTVGNYSILWVHDIGSYRHFFINDATTAVIVDSTGTNHTASGTFAQGDILDWRFIRKGTSLTAIFSSNKQTELSISTFGYSGLQQCMVRCWTTGERVYSIAMSNVAHAAEAGMAQRLYNWLFDIVGDSLQVTHSDSVYNVLINSRRAK